MDAIAAMENLGSPDQVWLEGHGHFYQPYAIGKELGEYVLIYFMAWDMKKEFIEFTFHIRSKRENLKRVEVPYHSSSIPRRNIKEI